MKTKKDSSCVKYRVLSQHMYAIESMVQIFSSIYLWSSVTYLEHQGCTLISYESRFTSPHFKCMTNSFRHQLTNQVNSSRIF